MTQPIAYLNGQFVPIEQAQLHVFDMGVVGGVAVTEMVRTFRHVPFRLDQHLDRLAHSLDLVGLDAGLTPNDWRSICEHVVAENAKLIPRQHDLGLIAFVTAGQNQTYIGRVNSASPLTEKMAQEVDQPKVLSPRQPPARLAPTVCVHTFPLPFELWADAYSIGLHLVSVPTRSIPDDVIDPRVKHRSRLHWHLAAREARSIDPAAMAILSDADGILTETATGNLCIVDGPTIITPLAHVLEGISRDYVAELAATLGIEFVRAAVAPDDLARADEAFLTSTPHCLLPVTRFNGQPIGSGQPGPVFQRLINAWSQAVGVDIIEQMRVGANERSRS